MTDYKVFGKWWYILEERCPWQIHNVQGSLTWLFQKVRVATPLIPTMSLFHNAELYKVLFLEKTKYSLLSLTAQSFDVSGSLFFSIGKTIIMLLPDLVLGSLDKQICCIQSCIRGSKSFSTSQAIPSGFLITADCIDLSTLYFLQIFSLSFKISLPGKCNNLKLQASLPTFMANSRWLKYHALFPEGWVFLMFLFHLFCIVFPLLISIKE